jgi:alkylation response protein AidB-like acyl-CoA dehydrogenase
VVRTIARRDVTLAFSLGPNLLGALPIWIAETEGQKARVKELIRTEGGLALANTEPAHGSDVIANETSVEKRPNGYRLNGIKWLISNASQCGAWIVLARTGEGFHGHSLFLVDRSRVHPEHVQLLPRIPTVGLRGADLSGVRFQHCELPHDALIGPLGCGFELLHRTLTVTKTLCCGLSLGASDDALKLTLNFARHRQLFDQKVIDLPIPRRKLRNAFLDLLTADAVAMSAVRAVQIGVAPVYFSSMAKFFVPVILEQMMRQLSVVLGARFYLRDGHPWALFQKLQRDASIVSTFEGNTLVNLSLLAKCLLRSPDSRPPSRPEVIRDIFDLAIGQEPIEPRRLKLDFSPFCESDPIPSPIPVEEWGVCEAVSHSLGRLLGKLHRRLQSLQQQLRDVSPRRSTQAGSLDPQRGSLIVNYSRCHAALACWHFWRFNRDRERSFFNDGYWLVLIMARLLRTRSAIHPSFARSVDVELLRRLQIGSTMGMFPIEPIESSSC